MYYIIYYRIYFRFYLGQDPYRNLLYILLEISLILKF